jgi:hypothetical protein
MTAVRTLIRRPRVWVWGAIMASLAVGLGQLPLVGVLGYELAIAVAIPAAIAGLDLGAALARELARTPEPAAKTAPGRLVASTTLTASALAVAVALVPAVIACVRGIWTTTCDWAFGALCYAAMPVATAALAGALGHLVGIVVGPRRWLCAALAQLPLLVLVAAGLYRFYAAPPVFSYSPVVGYFPGNMYDENVQLEMPLVWARLEQLAWLIGLGAVVAVWLDPARLRLARGPRLRVGAIAVAVVAVVGAAYLRSDAGSLGYAIDGDDIADELGGTYETAHWIIHYAKTDDIERDIALIARDHEFRYAEVVAETGVAPAGKLTSFYFANSDQKARWMGARDVEMAKPWRHEIYLDHRAFPHPSLRHEIAHAIASSFGDPIFGVAAQRVVGLPILINPGLIEGLAVALDWPGTDGRLTPHEAVRAMQTLGLEPSIGEVLSLQFFNVSSARGYTTAGSFLRFLYDRYGAAKLRAVYASGGDFPDAYGKPLDQLADEWRQMLAGIALPADVIEAQRERYRATSVFARPCPHAIAAARDRAAAALGAGDRGRAIAILRDVCARAPEEPRYRFELGDLLERAGSDDDDHHEAEALWRGLADDKEAVTTALRAEALDRLAHAAGARDDLAKARALVEQAQALPLDGADRRQLDAEKFAFDHGSKALIGYFFARVLDPLQWAWIAAISEPELGFGHYLLGLQRGSRGDDAGADAELQRALALGLPGRDFVDNGARKLAVAAYRTGDVAGVEAAIAALSTPDATTVDRLLAQDWRARLDFDKQLSKPEARSP